MNEEIITSAIEVNDTENNVSVTNAKVSKADKRLEKLTALKGKYEKAASAKEAAAKKADNINAQIEKLEKEIHAEEIAEIDRVLSEKGMSYKDIVTLLKSIPDGMTAVDVKNLFE